MQLSRMRVSLAPIRRPRAIDTPVDSFTTVHNIVVEIDDVDGNRGLGLVWTTRPENALVIRAMIQALLPAVSNSHAGITEVFLRMSKLSNSVGYRGIAATAMSAVDIALWDLLGKQANLPVWRLLGGARSEVEAYASGLYLGDDLETIVAEAKSYVAQGFPMIKMRVGLPDSIEDLRRVQTIRQEIGGGVRLAVDAVQAWDRTTAIRMGQWLADYDIEWLEDPVRYDDLPSMADVRQRQPLPIATGEKEYSLAGFRELLAAGAVDIVQPDTGRVGGITEWRRVSVLAESLGREVMPHALPEIGVQLAGGIAGCHRVEWVPFWTDLLTGVPAAKNGVIALSEEPGLGLTLREELLTETMEFAL